MKNILLIIVLLFLFANISFAGDDVHGFKHIRQNKTSYIVSSRTNPINNHNQDYLLSKNRLEIIYKTPHYNTPFYIYKNQFRVSVAEGVKFWIDYNDFVFLQKLAEDKASKYRARVSGTFRFRLPW